MTMPTKGAFRWFKAAPSRHLMTMEIENRVPQFVHARRLLVMTTFSDTVWGVYR